MKANGAPEKIYITPHFERRWFTKKIDDASVEYTRADAFIEKACDWLRQELVNFEDYSVMREEFIKDFKNYMKGD